MALYNYIIKKLHDDVAFVEFDRNLNFIPDDILHDIVACSGNHRNCSPCRMNFIRNEIADSLMKI